MGPSRNNWYLLLGAFVLGIIAAAVMGSAFKGTRTVTKTVTLHDKTTTVQQVPGPTQTVQTTRPLPTECVDYATILNRMFDQFTAFVHAYGGVPDELKAAVVAIGEGNVTAINAVTGNLKPMNEAAVQAEILLQQYMLTAQKDKKQCDSALK